MKKLFVAFVSFAVLVLGGSSIASYTVEQESAYNYAYDQKITTASSIEKANMDGQLTRIAMAKMISNFAINVLGLQPNTSVNCSFSDVSSSLDFQYNYGVTQACQLGLMGIGSDGKKSDKFNPYEIVTRAQFATAFSRALNKSNGTIINNGNPYYSTHLQYLQSKGIIKNVSQPLPYTVERRGNVMIMIMRAGDSLADEKQFQKIPAENLAKLKDKGVIRGPKTAKITIVEFTELLCPYCQRQSQQGTITSAIQQFSGQVNSISKPFIIHGDMASQLHSAMECVANLKPGVYYDVLEGAFGEYPVSMTGLVDIAVKNGVNEKSLQNCIDEGKYLQSVSDSMALGIELGVNGTPGSVVINNESLKYKIIPGAYPIETFVETIESLLN